MSDNLIHLDDSNFFEKIKENKLVLVDFWAEWCAPCQMFSSIFEEFAKENPEIICAKVNVDDSKQVASKFNIMSIPTIAIFKDGELVKQMSGALPKDMLKKLIDEVK